MRRKLVFFLVFSMSLFSLVLNGAVPAMSQAENMALHFPKFIYTADITSDPQTGLATFIRGRIPLPGSPVRMDTTPEEKALHFLTNYGEMLGVNKAQAELMFMQSHSDTVGLTHTTFQQVHQGLEVYGGIVKVHMDLEQEVVLAASSGFIPDIDPPTVHPQLSSEQAAAIALDVLPEGYLSSTPQLVIYAGAGSVRDANQARLAWLVEVRDDTIPARNVYMLDAVNGTILDVLDRLYVGHSAENAITGSRRTYTAQNTTRIPGTLVRTDDEPATRDQDVDNAHDFGGKTHSYYLNTHSRDSYDGSGATLISTAHYGRNYSNAFWNGSQMVYGDGFAIEDVVAHELTHAVTENTANLEYQWQSGALNESFSDIFGAMVDRNDWLIGEDLPPGALAGRDAIRDMADPARLGQPAHTDDWIQTCSDNEGVHSNSGIFNKGFYNVATAIGKGPAEEIYYRALAIYLQPTSSFRDARSALLQAAEDLYGKNVEYNAVISGLEAAGIGANWNPPENACTCAASVTVAATQVETDRVSALDTIITLYRVRDRLLKETEVGLRYYNLYYEYTDEINSLLLRNLDLMAQGGQLLRTFTPGLSSLSHDGESSEIVSEQMVGDVLTFLDRLAEDARRDGSNELAETVEREKSRVQWQNLVGMTFSEAWEYLNEQSEINLLYIPIVTH